MKTDGEIERLIADMPDGKLLELLALGRDSYVPGIYDIYRAEAERRRIVVANKHTPTRQTAVKSLIESAKSGLSAGDDELLLKLSEWPEDIVEGEYKTLLEEAERRGIRDRLNKDRRYAVQDYELLKEDGASSGFGTRRFTNSDGTASLIVRCGTSPGMETIPGLLRAFDEINGFVLMLNGQAITYDVIDGFKFEKVLEYDRNNRSVIKKRLAMSVGNIQEQKHYFAMIARLVDLDIREYVLHKLSRTQTSTRTFRMIRAGLRIGLLLLVAGLLLFRSQAVLREIQWLVQKLIEWLSIH
jgi:hypothetical protein